MLAALLWSLTSVGIGSTNSVIVIGLMRALLGALQSAGEPTMYSMISDYFPKDQRARANSAVVASVALGAGGSSMMIALISSYGWRLSYKLIGLVGLLIGFLSIFLVKAPTRGQYSTQVEPVSPQEAMDKPKSNVCKDAVKTITDVWENKVARYACVASSFRYTFGTIA